MIDIRKLKELVRLMVENDLTELDLKDKEETVAVRRGSSPTTIVNHNPAYYGAGGAAGAAPAHAPAPAHSGGSAPAPAQSPAPPASPPAAPAAPAAPSTAGLTIIKSPMVGTVYLSPNPDSPHFVAAGAKVSDPTTVCLIEAMKVFNEIKAECNGTIAQVLVKNGQAVEYGQALFGVKPE